jgi:hypothetical protein
MVFNCGVHDIFNFGKGILFVIIAICVFFASVVFIVALHVICVCCCACNCWYYACSYHLYVGTLKTSVNVTFIIKITYFCVCCRYGCNYWWVQVSIQTTKYECTHTFPVLPHIQTFLLSAHTSTPSSRTHSHTHTHLCIAIVILTTTIQTCTLICTHVCLCDCSENYCFHVASSEVWVKLHSE